MCGASVIGNSRKQAIASLLLFPWFPFSFSKVVHRIVVEKRRPTTLTHVSALRHLIEDGIELYQHGPKPRERNSGKRAEDEPLVDIAWLTFSRCLLALV